MGWCFIGMIEGFGGMRGFSTSVAVKASENAIGAGNGAGIGALGFWKLGGKREMSEEGLRSFFYEAAKEILPHEAGMSALQIPGRPGLDAT